MARWHGLQMGLQMALQMGLLGLAGCSISSVNSVHQQPQRHWFNATVELEGKVIDRVPLLGAAVYQLQDETGKIWILTEHSSLKPGERLRVRGKVRFTSIPIAGQEQGEAYIEEEKREVVPDDR